MPTMAKKQIPVDPTWPAWRKSLADMLNNSNTNMKELSLKAGLGETFVRDVVMRGREPTVSNWDALLAELRKITDQPITQSRDPREVEVIGVVQAGYWTESFEWELDDRYSVPIPNDVKYSRMKLFGAEMRGASMNKWRPEGTVIIFTDQIEIGEELKPGKRYVVERTNAAGEHECTVKMLWQDEDGVFWLLPESTDPRFQEPIKVNGNDGDTVRIMGRVTHTIVSED